MKKIAAILLAALMLTSLAGCGGNETTTTTATAETSATAQDETSDADSNDDQAADTKVTLGVLIYKYDDTYISTVRQALEAAAGDLGADQVELILNDGKGDQGTQNDQIDGLIQQGVDALIVNIVDIGAAPTVIDKAKAADLPIIFFNREPDADVIASYDLARFIGTTPSEAGVIQGEMMADIWENNADLDKNGDGIMQYVMLQGDPDNPEAIARTEFSISTVEANGIETERLDLQVANWDTEKANTATSAWISSFGDKIEFIVANNDGMAAGAISALQAAGYNTGEEGANHIPVVGVDATDMAQDLISKGQMDGTVLQDGPAMAQAVLAVAMNAAKGEDFLAGTSYKYDDSGLSVRIPYQPWTGN